LARKSQHASSHIDRFDSPVDVIIIREYLNLGKISPIHFSNRNDSKEIEIWGSEIAQFMLATWVSTQIYYSL